MKRKYYYQVSEIEIEGSYESLYDIFEVGEETIAYAVKWEYVEKIIEFLNSQED